MTSRSRPDALVRQGENSASNPTRRIPPAVWIVLLLILLGVVASLLIEESPRDSRVIQAAECRQVLVDGTLVAPEASVALPYTASGHPQRDYHLICAFDVPLSAQQLGDTALFVPAFLDSMRVVVNGYPVLYAELYRMRNLRFSTLPVFAPVPANYLQEGNNRFQVMVSAGPGRGASLDRMYVGSIEPLRDYFQGRWFTTAVLPTLGVGAAIAFAIVFAVVWAVRPRELAFGWMSAALALGALRGSSLVPDFGLELSGRPLWNLLVLWEVAATLMFCRTVAGLRPSKRDWVWAVPPAILTVLFLVRDGGATLSDLPMIAAMLMFGLYLLLGLWVTAQAAWRGRQDAWIVALGMTAISAFVVRDLMLAFMQNLELVFFTRAVYGGFLLAIALWLTLRFVRAMQELDNTAETLRERVEATQGELRKTYDELRVRREAEAVNRERARLMRDLHDGLGGELASMLALADSPEPRPAEIASHARAALADMRLIISSLEDYGGDLTLALGTWRERAGPQVRAAGLKLVWEVRDVPALARLGPAQTLDILRIVQEAVTNVIKHAQATRVTIETFETAGGVGLSVRDDGTGGAPGVVGNGIPNMQMRARRLKATLTLSRDEHGTCVRLVLPREFDAAS